MQAMLADVQKAMAEAKPRRLTQTKEEWLVGRGLVGFGAGFFFCFIPLWADLKMTAGWLLVLHSAGVLGRIAGYAAASGLV